MRIVPLLLSATVIAAAMYPTSSAGLTLVQGHLQDPGLDRAGFVGYPGFEVAGDYRYPRLELSGYISYSARLYERPVRPVRRPHRRPNGVRIRNRSTGEVLWVGNQPGGTVVVAQKAATKALVQELGPALDVPLSPPEVEGEPCEEVVDLLADLDEAPSAELANAERKEDEADAPSLLVLESRAALWAADLCLESRVEAHAAWRGGANGGAPWLQPAVLSGNRRRLGFLRI